LTEGYEGTTLNDFLAFKRKRSGKFKNYTPLNAKKEVVFQEACNLELVQLPSMALTILQKTSLSTPTITKTKGTTRISVLR